MKICPYCGDPHRPEEMCAESPPPDNATTAPPAPIPPADAPEPPWVVAAREFYDGGVASHSECVEIVKRACEAHAAALAQEVERFREQAHLREQHALTCPRCSKSFHEADTQEHPEDFWRCPLCHVHQHADCRWPIKPDAEVAALAQERDLLKRVVAEQGLLLPSEVDALRATVADLTAERDQALEQVDALNKGCVELERTVARLTAERDQLKRDLDLESTALNHRLREAIRERDFYETDRNELRLANERLTSERNHLATLLTEVMRWHADPKSSDYNECDTDPCAWCEQAKAALAPTQKEEA